jgi:outer membrane biosynthesis protein TonB
VSVSDLVSQDEDLLLTQLAESRVRLEGLARELAAVDGELEEFTVERHQHELLHEVCGALEKLDEVGAAGLFWGERATPQEGEAHVRQVRLQTDEFQKRLGEIEGRRQTLLEKLEREEQNGEFIEDDVFEAQWQEEQRKLEWLVDREIGGVSERSVVMPWARGGEDDQRFRKSLAASLGATLLIGLLLPFIDLPLPDAWEVSEVPDRLTSLIQQRQLPPPPQVQEETRPEEKEPEPVEEAPLLAEEGTPQPANEEPPKKNTAAKGILAFRENFSGLTEDPAVAELGAQARITRAGEAASGRPERSMVATQAPGSSGGINLASLSRDVGGGGGQDFAGVEVARATSTIGGGGGTDRPLSGGAGSARTDEEIQIVFDRHKSALYRFYNRELRRDPTLQGQMVLRLTIEPDGSVSMCELKSTNMKAPNLTAQVVERVRRFDFGAKEEIPAITIVYPIDFLPAT